MNGGPMNVRANGNIKLEVLEALDSNIYSSGAVTLNAAVTGTPTQPSIRGSLQLQGASFNLLDVPQGLSEATGTVQFNGNEAIIQNITGQSGGGKVTLAGSVTYGGRRAAVSAAGNGHGVHVEYPDSVTTQVGARLTLAGTVSSSLLSGTVIVQNVTLHSQADAGSILTSAATPPSSSSPSGGVLAGMRFDVRIRTSAGRAISHQPGAKSASRRESELARNARPSGHDRARDGDPGECGLLWRQVHHRSGHRRVLRRE